MVVQQHSSPSLPFIPCTDFIMEKDKPTPPAMATTPLSEDMIEALKRIENCRQNREIMLNVHIHAISLPQPHCCSSKASISMLCLWSC